VQFFAPIRSISSLSCIHVSAKWVLIACFAPVITKNKTMKNFIAALFVLGFVGANAQVSNYTFTKEGGQLTDIEQYPGIIITNHTVSDDDVWPAKIAIPFPFMFNGNIYDSVSISENGFIWFGNEPAANMADVINPITAAYSSNVKGIVSAMGSDMHPQINTGLTTTIKSGSTGTTGFHELIIEWKNASRWDAVSDVLGEDTIDFQIKLYEFTNRIEVAYGTFKLNPNINTEIEVGLRGNIATDFNTRKTDATHTWGNSAAGTLNTDFCVLNKDTMPSYGDLFVWMDLNQHPTAINTPAKNTLVKTYPNPTSGKLFIETPANQAKNIIITNISGQQLQTINCNNTTTAVDVAAYQNGVYFYQITDATDAVIANGKFTVTK
jgi:hypothetical protein